MGFGARCRAGGVDFGAGIEGFPSGAPRHRSRASRRVWRVRKRGLILPILFLLLFFYLSIQKQIKKQIHKVLESLSELNLPRKHSRRW